MYWDAVIQAWKLKTWGVINRGIVRNLLREEEKEEDIYLTQINNSHDYSTAIVTELGCQKTRRSTMLATHRIQKQLTYIQKKKQTKYTSMHQ